MMPKKKMGTRDKKMIKKTVPVDDSEQNYDSDRINLL